MISRLRSEASFASSAAKQLADWHSQQAMTLTDAIAAVDSADAALTVDGTAVSLSRLHNAVSVLSGLAKAQIKPPTVSLWLGVAQ